MKILVSSCLLGNNVKYNGKNNLNNLVLKLKEKYELIPICPEVMGNLSIPRSPSEIRGNKVVNKDNIDLTNNFYLGANKALNIAKENNIKYAILKEKSPSCGINIIYDGSFSSKVIKGSGITTRLLRENNIICFSENEIDKLLDILENE